MSVEQQIRYIKPVDYKNLGDANNVTSNLDYNDGTCHNEGGNDDFRN